MARGEDLIAQLEQHLSQPPVNLIGALPDIDLSEPFQKHLGSPLKILKCRYGDARFQHTLNGSQTCSAVRYFVRSMACSGAVCSFLTATGLPRQWSEFISEKGGYTAAHARRDTEAQPLPGRLRPWGWNLDEKSWISALKERIAEQPYRNSPIPSSFLDLCESQSEILSTLIPQRDVLLR